MRSGAIVPALAVALACGDSTGPTSVMGAYTLQSVGGSALPYLAAQSMRMEQDTISGQILVVDVTAHVINGSLRLHGDSTYTHTATHRVTEDFFDVLHGELLDTKVTTLAPDTTLGAFAVTGTSIQLTSSDGAVTNGSHSGDTIRLVWSGVAWVYQR
ncbi:MAG: hypothetical protein JSW71_21795 [Gemmatimonadota bacterium]|nr:MAG: hypothetical protein JSW71_21795 [Gemmatimonadota bacterium]